jgi:hypothetical protein
MNDEQEIAKLKGIDIIQSCETLEQLIAAKNYINLYLDNFNDNESYNDLIILYNKKDSELSNF